MAVRTDTQLHSTWSAVFLRKGGSDNTTRLWEDWDDETRLAAIDALHLQSRELPVILSKNEGRNTVLLTTRRLICGGGAVDVATIVDVKPIEFAETPKDELNELDVLTESGKFLRASVGPGPGYFGFWSVLLHIARSNRRKSVAQ